LSSITKPPFALLAPRPREYTDAALQLLQEQDEQATLADLRREIAIGIEQADRGELAPFDPHATRLFSFSDFRGIGDRDTPEAWRMRLLGGEFSIQ
jgi:hypothetical protein